MRLLAFCIAVPLCVSAQSLLVLSKGDHTLSIVDPKTFQVIARTPSGPDPHEVIASADGKMAYISNYGFGAYNTITPVDLVTHKTLPVIDLGALRGPHGLYFESGKLFFTAEAAKAIARYDPDSKKIDWIMGTGQNRTHMVMVNKDATRIVTSNVSSASISVIEQVQVQMPGPPPGARPGSAPPPGPGPNPQTRTDWNETVIPVGHGSEGFDISPDGREIWVGNSQDGTISVIDLASKTVTATLNANVQGANRVKFTPDGKYVFVSLIRGPEVVVLSAADRKEVKRIPVGSGAEGVLMDPNGGRAFVSATPDSYVAVIDLQSLNVTGKIQAGKEPDGLAWAK